MYRIKNIQILPVKKSRKKSSSSPWNFPKHRMMLTTKFFHYWRWYSLIINYSYHILNRIFIIRKSSEIIRLILNTMMWRFNRTNALAGPAKNLIILSVHLCIFNPNLWGWRFVFDIKMIPRFPQISQNIKMVVLLLLTPQKSCITITMNNSFN